MALEFLFEDEGSTDYKNLNQGDVLFKTQDLIDVLSQAHNYYADASDYTHFMVLTQSCDLMRRGKPFPKARYITLAAIRPLDVVVERLIKKYSFGDFKFPLPVCDKNNEILVRQALERLLHNTEDGLFFLKKDSHPQIVNELCVFLPLSVSVRNEHYDACLKSKIAQLTDIFQAKVGWLVGNVYSRVGTPDIEEIESEADKFKSEFFEEIVYQKSAWLSSPQLKSLKESLKVWERDNPNTELDKTSALELVSAVPDMLEMITERITTQLVKNGFLDDDSDLKRRVKNVLFNDTVLKKLIRVTQ